jgi:hypothetical protein
MKFVSSGPSIVLVILTTACGGTVSLGGPPDGGNSPSASASIAAIGSASGSTGTSGTAGAGGNSASASIAATGSASGSTGTSGTGSATGASGSSETSGTGSSGSGPTISFANDIMPIFQASCAKAGACHNDPLAVVKGGGPGKAGGRPYLGTAPDGGAETPMDIMKVYAGLLGPTPPNHITSWELVSPTPMPYITPGNPAKSFLMIKMDGNQFSYDPQCMSGDYGSCGLPMPSDDAQLKPLPEREKVRSWISQGAPNN